MSMWLVGGLEAHFVTVMEISAADKNPFSFAKTPRGVLGAHYHRQLYISQSP